MIRRLLMLIFLIDVCVSSMHANARTGAALVQVAQGQLQGASLKGDVSAFLGVPYAAPPVGELRWRAPAPPVSWRAVRDATAFGANCMQFVIPQGGGPWTHEFLVHGPVSEDCLFLNVWTPARTPGARLPIMVWIHGGGFTGGSGSIDIYNGEALAREAGIIVITVNYRLGVFGFFSHPELSEEGINGNQAGYDVIAALRWIRENARAFGGDKRRVTIAGQSGGAAMVDSLLMSPLARGLFAGAIAESFPMGVLPTDADLPAAQADGLSLAQGLDASSLAELRAADAHQILAKAGAAYRWPRCACFFVDGDFLREQPAQAFAHSRQNDVPTMAGIVDAESPFPTDIASYTTSVAARYGALSADFLKIFPASTDAEAANQVLISGRERLLSSMEHWAAARAHTSRTRMFLYLYAHTTPGPNSAKYRTFHTAEVPYVFGTLNASPERGFTEQDHEISARMMSYWGNFVKTGNPNGQGLPPWRPASGSAHPVIMELGDHWGPLAPLPAAHREFFESYYGRGGVPFLF